MGILEFVKGGVGELFIARPPDCNDLIVYKYPHPQSQIPNGARLEVRIDECAVFYRAAPVGGQPLAAVLPPGTYTVTTQSLPFLSRFVTEWTQGKAFQADVYFILTKEVPFKFGGDLGTMVDPRFGITIVPLCHGSYLTKVIDPLAFVMQYLTDATIQGRNEKVSERFSAVIKDNIASTLDGLLRSTNGSFLEMGKLIPELKNALMRDCPDFRRFGVAVTQFYELRIPLDKELIKDLAQRQAKLADQDQANLLAQKKIDEMRALAMQKQIRDDQQYQQDLRYAQMSGGSYQGLAAARAMMGAGEGFAKGMEGNPGMMGAAAQIAMGVGMAMPMQQMWAQQPAGPPPQQAARSVAAIAAGQGSQTNVACPKCAAQVPQAKFCLECGAAMPVQRRFCAECGLELLPNAKFCPNCGKPAVQ